MIKTFHDFLTIDTDQVAAVYTLPGKNVPIQIGQTVVICFRHGEPVKFSYPLNSNDAQMLFNEISEALREKN